MVIEKQKLESQFEAVGAGWIEMGVKQVCMEAWE